MKTKLHLLALSLVLCSATGNVWAGGKGGHHFVERHHPGKHFPSRPHGGGGSTGPIGAPEIDAASGGSAIALLGGLVLLLKEKRRKVSPV